MSSAQKTRNATENVYIIRQLNQFAILQNSMMHLKNEFALLFVQLSVYIYHWVHFYYILLIVH